MSTDVLSGVSVVVTGAGGPIGAAIARLLAEQGARVGVLDRDRTSVEATTTELHGRGLALVADILELDQLVAAREEFEAWAGPTSVVVANAGIAHAAPFGDLELADWQRIISTNLTGTMLTIQVFSRAMREAGSGRIITMASMSAVLANAHQAAYGSAKSGVLGLTRALALDLGRLGISVNAVCPGAVDTPAARRILSREAWQERVRRAPLGRLATPEDVAHAVAFLASPGAAFINGVTLDVDGGLHIAGIG